MTISNWTYRFENTGRKFQSIQISSNYQNHPMSRGLFQIWKCRCWSLIKYYSKAAPSKGICPFFISLPQIAPSLFASTFYPSTELQIILEIPILNLFSNLICRQLLEHQQLRLVEVCARWLRTSRGGRWKWRSHCASGLSGPLPPLLFIASHVPAWMRPLWTLDNPWCSRIVGPSNPPPSCIPVRCPQQCQ